MLKKMDHTEYPKRLRKLDLIALYYIAEDAKQACSAMPDNPNVGYYQDEIAYVSMELNRRGVCRI